MAAEVKKKRGEDVLRLSLIACMLLVLLRMSIGWQFFYEGIWKLETLSTAEPWTAAGYLKGAKGPFRDWFRGMVTDPDDLNQLDYDKVSARWDEWQRLFVAHHPDLNDIQRKKLDETLTELKAGKKDAKGKVVKPGLVQLLKDNPDWVGVVNEKHAGTIDQKRMGEIEVYKNMLARYEAKLKEARQNFEREHLDKLWAEIQAKRELLVGPVNALTEELHGLPARILNPEQISRGPSPHPATKIDRTDRITIWGLIGIGLLLMAGLFSRTAALGAAVMLTMFYLAIPPWPGVPEAPGPDHSFIVNKLFIEVIACLALAAMPSGRWIGLDALVRRFILRKKTD